MMTAFFNWRIVMDIIHLLEILKPVDNVVTIKIDDGKSWLEAISAFLLAIAPTAVGLFALWTAHGQFNKSLSAQTKQFQKNVEQQVNELRLNTRLMTEIELKKELCRDVQSTCVDFLEHAGLYSTCYILYEGYGKSPEADKDEKNQDLIRETFSEMLAAHRKMVSSRAHLRISIDPESGTEFLASIEYVYHLVKLNKNTEVDNKRMGEARNKCLVECRVYISTIKKEIISLSDTLNEVV